MNESTIKTPKGTILPLIKLKGKDYLQVAHRLVWFREEHPDWSIHTSYILIDKDVAVCKAEVSNEKGECLSTGHKMETPAGFSDYIEKAETGSIGRALAHIGYGTQFAPDLDEGERLVDSPVIRPIPQVTLTRRLETPTKEPILTPPLSNPSVEDMDFTVNFGKFKGQRLSKIPTDQAQNYAKWLLDGASKSGKPLGRDAKTFVDAVL